MTTKTHCRFCHHALTHTFIDLGMSPLANSYLEREKLQTVETFYPLNVLVCEECFLVQLQEYENPKNIFSDYAYFSSFSSSWLKHAENYSIKMIQKFSLTADDVVMEIASNDGYLLQYFKNAGIPVVGIEPAANVAEVARKKGIDTRVCFFGKKTAEIFLEEGLKPKLLLGNNVLAHVPDINDFVAGMKILLAKDGIITMEFPHLLNLIEKVQFDTIYQEHYSYLSFSTVLKIFKHFGLELFDVEEIPTHGGSLRIYAKHEENKNLAIEPAVQLLLEKEQVHGLTSLSTYSDFTSKVSKVKNDTLLFLIQAHQEGKSCVGYGAPAKGNTFLNYCGIKSDLLQYTVDKSPHKQGHFLPGSHIPIYGPEMLEKTKPDYVLILPWNLKDEITAELSDMKDWKAKCVVAIPELKIIS